MVHEVDFWSDINLHGGSIRNVTVDALETAPDSPTAGTMYFNTTDNAYYYYNGSSWIEFAQGGDLSSYQLASEKDAADGYAGLDSSGKVIIGEIPTGASSGTVPLLVADVSDGYLLRYDEDSGGFVGYSIANIYTYRGSVATYAALPSDASAGDVYNVVAAYGNYPAGTNWAWNGSEWDALGGSIDLSGYQTVANLVTDLTSASDSTYPSTSAVSSALAEKQDVLTAGDGVTISDDVVSLSASGVTAGSKGSATSIPVITVDAYGRVTALSAVTVYPPTTAGTAGQYWVSQGAGVGTWADADTTVTVGSTNLVTSGAVAAAVSAVESDISGKADAQSVTAGTYTKVTVTSQGVVSAADVLSAEDVPDLDASKIVSGTFSPERVSDADATDGYVLVYNNDALEYGYRTSYASVQITGDGSTTSFTVTHNLGVLPIITMYNADNKVVYTDVEATTSVVTVSFNTAPTADETYTLVLVG